MYIIYLLYCALNCIRKVIEILILFNCEEYSTWIMKYNNIILKCLILYYLKICKKLEMVKVDYKHKISDIYPWCNLNMRFIFEFSLKIAQKNHSFRRFCFTIAMGS